jgi:lipopolysaccharide cholinephosphotransferase
MKTERKQYVSEKEEIICDYKVTVKQKKIWNVELDLLERFLDFCKKNDLKVFAAFGTLLGAVRHKGFIPWDDDMDVIMPREDFDKACKLAPSYFNEPYFFQTANTDSANFFPYARLRNSNTTGYIYCLKNEPYNQGIFIDIFVLDKAPINRLKCKTFLLKRKVCEFVAQNYMNFSSRKKYSFLKPFLKLYCCNHSYSFVCKKYEEITKKFIKLKKSWYVNSANMLQIFNPKDFLEEDLVDFYGFKLPIPKNYDEILRESYGDYMSFPPIEKRGTWHDGIIYFDPDMPYKEYVSKILSNKKS